MRRSRAHRHASASRRRRDRRVPLHGRDESGLDGKRRHQGIPTKKQVLAHAPVDCPLKSIEGRTAIAAHQMQRRIHVVRVEASPLPPAIASLVSAIAASMSGRARSGCPARDHRNARGGRARGTVHRTSWSRLRLSAPRPRARRRRGHRRTPLIPSTPVGLRTTSAPRRAHAACARSPPTRCRDRSRSPPTEWPGACRRQHRQAQSAGTPLAASAPPADRRER